MPTVLEILNKTVGFFEQRGIDNPKFEAQLILAHALKMERLQLFLRFDQPVESGELEQLRECVRRRGQGEPYAYVVGTQEFWSLDFQVGPGVLIPRPDTETLVQAMLDLLPEGKECFVADICAGTGCVGIALASERPEIKVYATELSPEALPYLRANVAAHELEKRVAVLGGDLMAPIPDGRRVDWVVSNPPYISSAEMQGLQVAKTEPSLALHGGADGLDVYRKLIPAAAARAREGVAVEIGHEQGEAVKALFESAGLSEIKVLQDLAKRDRVVLGLKAPAAIP